MGMASSQARLLNLTSRMHQIEYKAAKIEAEKLQMANHSKRVYQEYQNALEATKIQYKSINSDGSVTFLDATLAILENNGISSYNGITASKTFLLQNAETGEIYVTEALVNQYPFMGENIEDPGTQENYLHEKGIDPETVYEDVTEMPNEIKCNINYGTRIQLRPPRYDSAEINIPTTDEIAYAISYIFSKYGDSITGGVIQDEPIIYKTQDEIYNIIKDMSLENLYNLTNAAEQWANNYRDNELSSFAALFAEHLNACLAGKYDNGEYISGEEYMLSNCPPLSDTYETFTINQESQATTQPVDTGRREYNTSDENYIKYFKEWQIKRAAYDKSCKFVVVDNELANNKDFLNNHLTTNQSILIDWDIFIKNEENPETSVATNTFFQEVDDEKELRKAEAKYEADMRRIDMKDRKFDYDLAALDAERNAIKQEMETLKTVAKDNVDRTFRLFS